MMRLILSLCSLLLLIACVPVKMYENKLKVSKEKSKIVSNLTKELQELKNEILLLKKEISLYEGYNDNISLNKNAGATAEEIKKRLEKYGIISQLDDNDLSKLEMDRYFPLSGEYYQNHMKENPCRNPDTARNFDWLSVKEKDVYYWLNYARMYPKKFCDEYILPKLGKDKKSIDPYLITLVDELYKMPPLNALIPDKEVYESAKCHAISSGNTGYIGHVRQGDCYVSFSGECCSYGDLDALGHIINLLIDEGITSLGHRKICLGFYNKVGIALASHKSYEENLVLDFK